MPALTLDGLASAASLPAHTDDLLDTYSTDLARMAVDQQRAKSVAIADLLGLIVVTNDEEWYVAADADDMLVQWREMMGKESMDDYGPWHQMGDEEPLTIMADVNGDVADDEDDVAEALTRSAGEWAQRNGPRLLATIYL